MIENHSPKVNAARGRKETKYAEILRSRRCRLVVVALKVGGRWSDEALDFVRLLVKSKTLVSLPVGHPVGLASLRLLPSALWRALCWRCLLMRLAAMATHLA